MPTERRDHRAQGTEQQVRLSALMHKKAKALKIRDIGVVPSVADLARVAHTGPTAANPSTVEGTSSQPEGFGLTVRWGDEASLAIVAFIVASDEAGLFVEGVTDGDTFQLSNAVGTATFAQETKNEGIASIITIVGAGAAIGTGAFASPAAGALVLNAGKALADRFPEQNEKAKSRDAYGQILGEDEFARQEGGVIVCSPDAQGMYYSGNGDHTHRWIRGKGEDRSEANKPVHVQHGFFLQRDRKVRILDGDGTLVLGAWDYKFEDNVGAYRVDFILRRADRVIAPVP